MDLTLTFGLGKEEFKQLDMTQAKELYNSKQIASYFQQFQASINSVSATPPGWDEVVDEFNLLVVMGDDGIPYVEHGGLDVLPKERLLLHPY